ncbi:hypothetical protein MARPU_07435 [Marichromatium purpuratum 984]|uniref:Uncharacterized protein n=1 Tax=Marichromatium purpuratum 984 TaxID=765910 RepID=W0E3X8_MARPU|nr:hypothetical protein [Marichromatium purpuratum]AHF05462.1 hypothetical protein MARPU_07435 [Marichromatium purpuratum 984]
MTTPQGIDLLWFHANRLGFALERRRILALELADSARAPHITELLRLSSALDEPPAQHQRQLLLAHPEGALRVRVDEPISLYRVQAGELHPLPPLLAACSRLPWLRALAWKDAPVMVLDPWHDRG